MKTKLLTTLAAATTAALPIIAAPTPDKPNVILILADDLALGDLSLYNKNGAETPHIDRLLKSGVNFRQAYAASAVSAPSRAALLTGMYPHRTGCVDLNAALYPEFVRIKAGIPTIADLFKNNGYLTALIGKWHCGVQENYRPWQRGFTHVETFSLSETNDEFFTFGIRTPTSDTKYENKYLTDELGDLSVKFVRENKNKPFFLHLAHKAPHRPLQAPAELVEKYKSRGFDKKIATIYAMVEILDNNIGKLLAELETQKLLENTIIIFSSDNGPDPIPGPRFNLNLKGTKYTVNEGGINVPFALYWKGRLENKESPEQIHFIDVLPTLADLCQINIPNTYDLDGQSLAPALLNQSPRETPIYYWQWNRGLPHYSHNAAMRFGKWKLVRPLTEKSNFIVITAESTEPAQLYNLDEDPFETTDLSTKKENKKTYDQMRVRLEQWSRQVEQDRLTKSK